MPHEDKSRDWSDVSTSQGTPRIAGNHKKLGEKRGVDYPSGTLVGINNCLTLVSDFQPPEQLEKTFLLSSAVQSVVVYYGSLKRLVLWPLPPKKILNNMHEKNPASINTKLASKHYSVKTHYLFFIIRLFAAIILTFLLVLVVGWIIKYMNEFQIINTGEWFWGIYTVHIENKNRLLKWMYIAFPIKYKLI